MIDLSIEKRLIDFITNKSTGKLISQRCTDNCLKNQGYYDYIINRYNDNTTDSFKEPLYRIVHHIDEVPKCKMCGKHLMFKPNDCRYQGTYCCRKCQNSDPDLIAINAASVSKTLKNVYKERGDSVKEKRAKTLKNKYADSSIESCSPFAYKKVQTKIKSTIKEKYGVENVLQLAEFRKDSKEKARKNSVIIWKERGYDIEYTDHDTIIIKNGCSVHGDIELDIKTFNNRMKEGRRATSEICPICNKIHYLSGHESLLKKFFENINVNCIINDRKIIHPLELDFYLPDYKLAIEMNGVYFHGEFSTKPVEYHKHKTDLCEEKGVQLIHIWEDDWVNKNDLVISMLKNKLGISEHKIGARECEIKEVSSKDSRLFLDENHLQGAINSKYKFGLYHNNELVALMTFGNLRKAVGMSSDKTTCELYRYCVKQNWIVQGGASKLFKYAVDKLKSEGFEKILTFAKRDWSNGNLYRNLGFNYIETTVPGYFWIDTHLTRLNRYSCRKSNIAKTEEEKKMTEVEIMHNRGFFRCYDSGNLKFVYNII